MRVAGVSRRTRTVLGACALGLAVFALTVVTLPAQQWVTETRDPKQAQDEEFAKLYKEWTGDEMYGSPLVDHLPKVPGIRVASLPAHAVVTRAPDTTRWSPAVFYYPAVTSPKQMWANREMFPPTARRMRVVRGGRPYRVRRSHFSVVIGVGPRW